MQRVERGVEFGSNQQKKIVKKKRFAPFKMGPLQLVVADSPFPFNSVALWVTCVFMSMRPWKTVIKSWTASVRLSPHSFRPLGAGCQPITNQDR